MRSIYTMGDRVKPQLLVLHPLFFSAKIMASTAAIRELSRHYYLIIPDIAAHGSLSAEPFVNYEQARERLFASLKTAGVSPVFAAGLGFSMGARLLLDIKLGSDKHALQDSWARELKLPLIVLDGLPLYRDSETQMRANVKQLKLFYRLLKLFPRLVKHSIQKDYGEAMAEALLDSASSLSEADAAAVVSHAVQPLPAAGSETQHNCLFLFGAKEPSWKHFSQTYFSMYPESKLHVEPACKHIQFALSKTQAYVDLVEGFIGNCATQASSGGHRIPPRAARLPGSAIMFDCL